MKNLPVLVFAAYTLAWVGLEVALAPAPNQGSAPPRTLASHPALGVFSAQWAWCELPVLAAVAEGAAAPAQPTAAPRLVAPGSTLAPSSDAAAEPPAAPSLLSASHSPCTE
jgi:hypothetical protein